jgi:hypothetical protein
MRDRNGPRTGEVTAIFGLPSFRSEWALCGITYPTFQMASITSNKGTCEPMPRNSVIANKIALDTGKRSQYGQVWDMFGKSYAPSISRAELRSVHVGTTLGRPVNAAKVSFLCIIVFGFFTVFFLFFVSFSFLFFLFLTILNIFKI